MKRFTQTMKWEDSWFRKLSPKLKCFWFYMLDRCDNAGVWKPDYELAGFFIGEPITADDLNEINAGKERIKVLPNGSYQLIDFIDFQTGNLSGETLTNLQKNCLALIKKYSDIGCDITRNDHVANGYKYKGKGKGKGTGTAVPTDVEKKNFVKPSNVEVTEYATSIDFSLDGSRFCDYYESNGWRIGKNPMKDWRAAVRTWKRNGYKTGGSK